MDEKKILESTELNASENQSPQMENINFDKLDDVSGGFGLGELKGWASEKFDSAKSLASSAWDSTRSFAEGALDVTSDAAKSAWDWGKKTARKVGSGIEGSAKKAGNWFTERFNR